MRSLLVVVMLGACGTRSATAPKTTTTTAFAPTTKVTVELPPVPDVTATVDATAIEPAAMRSIRDRCFSAAQIATRRRPFDEAREAALHRALAAAGLRPITLESRWIDAAYPDWTQATIDGATWLAGPSEHVECANQVRRSGNERFVSDDRGQVFELDLRGRQAPLVELRQCGACRTGSGMCGAHLPETVQMLWKLPADAHYEGTKHAFVDGPDLVGTRDPEPASCPPFQPPP